ncbi:MAG: hypothetical protein NXI08_17070, partial [bacterium]|nr:hypothetical protein [bacterium]
MAVLSAVADFINNGRFIKACQGFSAFSDQEREVWGYLCRDEMRLSQCRACLPSVSGSLALPSLRCGRSWEIPFYQPRCQIIKANGQKGCQWRFCQPASSNGRFIKN